MMYLQRIRWSSLMANHLNHQPQRRWRTVDMSVPSFMQIAKERGVKALLGRFPASKRFDQCVQGLEIHGMEDGVVNASIVVDERVQNSFLTLHGGAVATLVDIAGTLALISKDVDKPGVSVELNVSYCAAAKAGSTVLVKGKVLKMGARLGYTQVELHDKDSGKLIAIGRQTKYL